MSFAHLWVGMASLGIILNIPQTSTVHDVICAFADKTQDMTFKWFVTEHNLKYLYTNYVLNEQDYLVQLVLVDL